MTIHAIIDSTIPKYSSVCSFCKHLHADKERACAAFPKEESIPLPIWLGNNDHTTPYAGDHGIMFDPVDSAAPDARKSE